VSEPFLPEQRLTLAQALSAYTYGSAFANHLEETVGTVAVGAAADLVVLDRDPFAGHADDIHAARVKQTYVDGELVYSDADSSEG
jgi:predicted amidohydrolase YtcJ